MGMESASTPPHLDTPYSFPPSPSRTLFIEMKAGVRNTDSALGEMAFCSRSPRFMRRGIPVPHPGKVAVTCFPDRSKRRLGELNM